MTMNEYEDAWIMTAQLNEKKDGCKLCMRPLVLCKDCVYWQDNNAGYPHIGCKWREDETPDPDDFCSAGERKEGGEVE